MKTNALLEALSIDDSRVVAPSLEHVDLVQGAVLFDASRETQYVYFPDDAVITLTADDGNDAEVQVATAGREGFAGLHLFLHTASPSINAVVQIAGAAQRMRTGDFEQAVRRSDAFAMLLHQYTDAFLLDLALTAACNARHRVRERCARWLSTAEDRIGRRAFSLSISALAAMVGSHDDGVSSALRTLRDAGVIDVDGGSIAIEKGAALRELSCPCYRIARDRFARVGVRAAPRDARRS